MRSSGGDIDREMLHISPKSDNDNTLFAISYSGSEMRHSGFRGDVDQHAANVALSLQRVCV